MKRRKPPEPSRPEFNNNPFTFLRKMKPAADPKRQPPAPEKKPTREDDDELFLRAMAGTSRLDDEAGEARSGSGQDDGRKSSDEDDSRLFLNAMSGTRPIEPGKKRPAAADADREKPAEHDDDRALFVQALQHLGANLRVPEPDSDFEKDQPQSPSSRVKQLRRGTIRISAELDLHGSLRDEALAKLKNFVAAAYSRRQKAVLVITGKGINSPEGPVLQGAVAGWLRDQGRGMVAEFTPAPRDKGGSGAYVVFLKNRPGEQG